MIFLAVSGALFTSVITLFSEQNQRTEFSSAVRNFDSRLQDILNDVDSGYYPPSSNLNCTIGGGGWPNPGPGANPQGTNQNCTFVGKAIQFEPAGAGGTYNVYTIVGRRVDDSSGTNEEITDINDARPVAIAAPQFIETGNLTSTLEIYRVVTNGDSAQHGGFGILAGFGRTLVGGSGLQSGSSKFSLASIGGTNLNQAQGGFITSISGLTTGNINQAAAGITICLREDNDSTNRARITISGEAQRASTETIVQLDATETICTP